MERIVLLGCGGHAKSIIDSIESSSEYEIAGFVDKSVDNDYSYKGYKVIGCDDDLISLYNNGIKNAFVCVGFMGKGNIRNALYSSIKEIGFHIPAIIDKSTAIATDAVIGEGTFIGKNAVVNSNAVIGKMSIINTAAVVDHDCAVGDFTHISVGTVLCGAVSVGQSCFIGANSTVIQEIIIGNDVIIGAGSTVIGNVSENTTRVGIVK